MVPTVLVLMITHALEVLVWALGYFLVGAAPEGADRVYFAFVNYTTLGYGDVVPVERWRLIGPITAMNGVLLFGWSTAVIFEVLRRALEIARGRQRKIRRRRRNQIMGGDVRFFQSQRCGPHRLRSRSALKTLL